jgi:RimJ/RimL family protein N-acetyltransferase
MLRPFEPGDAADLLALLNHPELAGRRGLPWGFNEELPLTAGQVEKVLDKWGGDEDSLHLAIAIRDSQELIGHAELERGWDPHAPSLWLLIAPAHQRQGYGSEALRLLLDYYFNYTPAHNVSVWAADWNQPAQAFARKHGFQECGLWRRDGLRGGAYVDSVGFEILRPEWKARKSAQTPWTTQDGSGYPSTAGFDAQPSAQDADQSSKAGFDAQPSAQDADQSRKEG